MYEKDIYSTVINADAILLVTEWKEFRLPDWELVKQTMRHPVIFDGRNIYEEKNLRTIGFTYYGIGAL